MKQKALSLALALTMCLSLTIPAFAEESGWKMEVLGKSDAEAFVGERTFTVRDYNKGDYDADRHWNATLKTDTREWKVDNLCVMAKDDIAVFTKGGESFDGFFLTAWSDPDGDGVYDNIQFGGEFEATRFADSAYSGTPFYNYAMACFMPNRNIYDWKSEYGGFDVGINMAEDVTELKLPAESLLELYTLYGPNILVMFFGDSDDGKSESICTVLLEGDTAQSASPRIVNAMREDENVRFSVSGGSGSFLPLVAAYGADGRLLSVAAAQPQNEGYAASVNVQAVYVRIFLLDPDSFRPLCETAAP